MCKKKGLKTILSTFIEKNINYWNFKGTRRRGCTHDAEPFQTLVEGSFYPPSGISLGHCLLLSHFFSIFWKFLLSFVWEMKPPNLHNMPYCFITNCERLVEIDKPLHLCCVTCQPENGICGSVTKTEFHGIWPVYVKLYTDNYYWQLEYELTTPIGLRENEILRKKI